MKNIENRLDQRFAENIAKLKNWEKEEIKSKKDERPRQLFNEKMAEWKILDQEDFSCKKDRMVLQHYQEKMTEHETLVVKTTNKQSVTQYFNFKNAEANQVERKSVEMVKQPLLEDRRYGSLGRKRECQEVEKQLIKAERDEDEEVWRNGMEWSTEMVNILVEDKESESRGVKRKGEDFATHPIKAERNEDWEVGSAEIVKYPQEGNRSEASKVRRKSVDSFPSEPGEVLLELGEVKSESREETMNSNKENSSGSEEAQMALLEDSLLSKLIDDIDESSVEKFSHQILIELEEMHVIKSEQHSKEPFIEEGAREEEEALKSLEHYDAMENSEMVDIIVPEIFDTMETDSTILSDAPILSNNTKHLQQKLRQALTKVQNPNFGLWEMLTRERPFECPNCIQLFSEKAHMVRS